MAGDAGRLKHDVSQLAPSSSNGALATHGAAVMYDRSQARERGGLFTRDWAEFRHLGDQHGAGDGTDSGNGTQDTGSRRQVIIRGHGLVDPLLQLCYLAIEKAFQLDVHGVKHICRSQLPVRVDLRGWQLPGRDPGSVEGGPQSPFLPASSLEANQRAQFESELSDLLVTVERVCQSLAPVLRQIVDIQSIAAGIYPDDLFL